MQNQNERLIAMLKEIIEYRQKAGSCGFQLDKLDDKIYKAEVLLEEIKIQKTESNK